MQKQLHNLFKINIHSIPDETFIEGVSLLNKSGEKVTDFRKVLPYMEYNIFDIIEVKKFETSNLLNVFFKSYNLNKVQLREVKKLVDDLYMIYGPDDSHKGMLNAKDTEAFYSTQWYQLFGRNWTANTQLEIPLSLNIDRETNCIDLTLWGVTKKMVLHEIQAVKTKKSKLSRK